MKKLVAALLASSALVFEPAAHASLVILLGVAGGGGGGGGVALPVNTLNPEVVGLDYPNDGASTAATGTTLTLNAKAGQWDDAPTGHSYSWHKPDGTVLGSGPTLTLDTSNAGVIGTLVEVDDVAANAAGSATATSHWFGPIEGSAPVAPEEPETDSQYAANRGPTSLPTEYTNWLLNGHAVFPGCTPPPAAPTYTASGDPHVWFFDPVNGRTQKGMSDGSDGDARGVIAAANIGHSKANAFKDVGALFAPIAGYDYNTAAGGQPNKLFGTTGGTPLTVFTNIQPGDTIYIGAGWGGSNPLGDIGFTGNSYSTSDGTSAGAVHFTWILPDPSATSIPVLHSMVLGNGGNGAAAGFIVKDLAFEAYLDVQNQTIAIAGSQSFPTHDIYLENLDTSMWRGHASDPWPGNYPTSNGTSNGTVTSASPVLSRAAGQDPKVLVAAASANSNQLLLSAIPPVGWYVWSPGLFRSIGPGTNNGGYVSPSSTGIPNGTKIAAVNGLTTFTFAYIYVNEMTPAQVAADNNSSLTLGGVVRAVANLPASGDSTTYYVVQPKLTSNQTVYIWRGTAWTSIGTALPQSTNTANAVAELFPADKSVHFAFWTGSAWQDRGPITATLAPCDGNPNDTPNDIATGCPSSAYTDPVTGLTLSGTGYDNIPGCDPVVTAYNWSTSTRTRNGGCPTSGSPPALSGTTRALSGTGTIGSSAIGEQVSFTDMMVITPSGAFNSSDWNGNSTSMINVSGGLSSTQKDTAHPNNFMGAKCISLKGNKLRDVRRGIQLTRVTNSVLYDNRIKFFSEDAVDEYSDNRILSAHNLIEDSVQSWAHQDAIQKAISGSGSGYMYFGNAEIENEMYEATDATNYMPKGMEGIITTDEEWWGNYSADNISVATTNGIHTTGAYDVSVHNTVLGQAVTLDWNKKEAKPTFQINGLMANNVANGINRAPYIFNCSGTTTDPLITLKTNVAIPFVPGTGATSVIACNGTTIINGGNPGAFDGLDNWNATDWRSGGATASSLFVSYHPVDPAPPGGYLQNTWTGGQGVNNTCAHGTFPGSCPAGNGTVDLRPNPSFAGFTGSYSLRVQYPQNLPNGRADGTLAMVASTVRAAQAGIWSACASCSLYTNGTTIHWQFVSPSYNPGIIGAGTNLGPQQPLTDIEGKAWKASPTIGAFEAN